MSSCNLRHQVPETGKLYFFFSNVEIKSCNFEEKAWKHDSSRSAKFRTDALAITFRRRELYGCISENKYESLRPSNATGLAFLVDFILR